MFDIMDITRGKWSRFGDIFCICTGKCSRFEICLISLVQVFMSRYEICLICLQVNGVDMRYSTHAQTVSYLRAAKDAVELICIHKPDGW